MTSPRGSMRPTSRSRPGSMPRSCARSVRVCSIARSPRSRGRSPSAACSRAPPPRCATPVSSDEASPGDRPRPIDRRVLRGAPAHVAHDARAANRAARRARARGRRSLVRVLPPLRGRAAAQGRHHQERHLPHRDQAAARRSPRWVSTCCTCRRSTRSDASTARDATTRSTRSRVTPARLGPSASAEGGHDAVHPDLGTLADFRAFVRAARAEGIEVALDLALQAAPDHPWVAEHPEWFTTLARRHRSPTPRTRPRSTRTSTRSTSTTTPRASAPRCCASCVTGSRRA